MTRLVTAALAGCLSLLAVNSATAQLPGAAEVRLLVQMPLATNAVVEIGVPAPQVERTVLLLNQARVPVVESVEILRFTPFPLVVERYIVSEPVAVEPRWDLATLDMPVLLETRHREGFTGLALAHTVLRDLEELGFPVVVARQALVTRPPPLDPGFVIFVQPGFPFDSRRGIFRDRVVVVEEDFVPRRQPGPPPHARGKGPPETVPPPHARGKGPPETVPPPHARGKGPPATAPSPHARGKGPPETGPPPHARGKGPPAQRPPGQAQGQERGRGGPPGQARGEGRRDSPPGKSRGKSPGPSRS